jgi:hypothetical protein
MTPVQGTSIPGIIKVATGKPSLSAVLPPDAGTDLAAVVYEHTFPRCSIGTFAHHV